MLHGKTQPAEPIASLAFKAAAVASPDCILLTVVDPPHAPLVPSQPDQVHFIPHINFHLLKRLQQFINQLPATDSHQMPFRKLKQKRVTLKMSTKSLVESM